MKFLATAALLICIPFAAQADLLDDYKSGILAGYVLMEDAHSSIDKLRGTSGEQERFCYLVKRHNMAVKNLAELVEGLEARKAQFIITNYYSLRPTEDDLDFGTLKLTYLQLSQFKVELKYLKQRFPEAHRRCS